MGYGANVDLAESLVSELQVKGLARPSEDGVSIPLHPEVRTTILVILAQLARSAGNRKNLSVHPATCDRHALQDLINTLSRERMPSRHNVIAFDLEPVSFNMDAVPLDELLQFRAENQAPHRAYMRDLRGFVAELAEVNNPGNEKSFYYIDARKSPTRPAISKTLLSRHWGGTFPRSASVLLAAFGRLLLVTHSD